MAKRKAYVGFYWTRPAPQVGFIDIPADVDAAAASSRTIRYQRDLVRRWVQSEKGDLIAEYAALDVAPDRDTDAITDDVRRAASHAQSHGAALVVVDFLANAGWRPQRPMQRQLDAAGVRVERLYPDQILIDGKPFDPIGHFRAWQAFYVAAAASKPEAKAAIAARINGSGPADATWPEMAAWLNAEGYRTLNGKAWTADNVRKFLKA